VIMGMLAKQPGDRPSLDDFERELAAVEAGL
jgi:hypothetical protein